MSTPHRVKLHIDSLRTQGMTKGEANALAEGLKQALQAQLQTEHSGLRSTAALHVTVPLGSPTQNGAAIASQIVKRGGRS